MDKLQKVRLEDITVNWDKKRIPLSSAERANLEKKYRYYGAQGVIDYVDNFLFDGDYVLVAEDGENLRSQRNNICNYVTGKFWVNNHAHIIQAKEDNDLKYIYYRLNLVDFRPYITGSAQPKLTQDNLNSIELTIHDLSTQQKIAAVLSALDAKIELNARINAELDFVAKTVFRYQFVENKEKGNWKIGTLGDIAENIRRSANPNEIKPETHYIGLEHMPRKSIALADYGNASELESNKYAFKTGEFLFGKLRPYFHKVGIAPVDGVCSTDILVIAPKSPEWYGFVLGHISSDEIIKYADATSGGTKMPRTNWESLAKFEISIPPVETAKEFSEFFVPTAKQIRTNILESQTLTELRDWLLPMLMNGQVKV